MRTPGRSAPLAIACAHVPAPTSTAMLAFLRHAKIGTPPAFRYSWYRQLGCGRSRLSYDYVDCRAGTDLRVQLIRNLTSSLRSHCIGQHHYRKHGLGKLVAAKSLGQAGRSRLWPLLPPAPRTGCMQAGTVTSVERRRLTMLVTRRCRSGRSRRSIGNSLAHRTFYSAHLLEAQIVRARATGPIRAPLHCDTSLCVQLVVALFLSLFLPLLRSVCTSRN